MLHQPGPLLNQRTICPGVFEDLSDKKEDYRVAFKKTSRQEETHPLYMEQFLETTAKCDIMDFVLRMSENLASNKFHQTVGPASKILVGTKGVGKTNTLRRAAILVASRYPDVVVLYHEYSSTLISSPRSLLQKAIINKVGLCSGILCCNSIVSIQSFLYQNRLRALLLLDEVENIYHARESARQAEALRVIDDLLEIGSNNSGRFAIIICGSSVTLPRLVSGNAVEGFELSRLRPPNLNGSKFMSKHVSQPALNAKEVSQIFQYFLGLNDINDTLMNELCFFLHPNLRRLQEYGMDLNHEQYFQTILQHEFDSRASITRHRHRLLIRRINRGLWQVNESLLRGLIDKTSNTVIAEQVCKVLWTTALKPLEIERWDSADEEANVQHLVDNGWFLATSDLKKLWPLTPASLLFADDMAEDSGASELKTRAVLFLRTFSSSVLGKAASAAMAALL